MLFSVGTLGIEPRLVQSTCDIQSRPEPRRSALPKNERASKGFSREAPAHFGFISPSLCWSLPFVGDRGLLTLGPQDGGTSGTVHRAYGHYGPLVVPDGSCGCGCDQHGPCLRRRKISATASRCQRSTSHGREDYPQRSTHPRQETCADDGHGPRHLQHCRDLNTPAKLG
jgi:hypothetical protein